MQLVILLLIVAWLGYRLAKSQTGTKIDKVVVSSTEKSKELFFRSRNWLGSTLGRNNRQNQPLRVWALGVGAELFPLDFRQWLAGLSDEQADQFEQSLTMHLTSLGYQPEKVISKQESQNPAFLQIFVEAVVVYSREYQKAVRAKKGKMNPDREEVSSATPKSEEKAVAQKQSSRRKNTTEAVQPAGAD